MQQETTFSQEDNLRKSLAICCRRLKKSLPRRKGMVGDAAISYRIWSFTCRSYSCLVSVSNPSHGFWWHLRNEIGGLTPLPSVEISALQLAASQPGNLLADKAKLLKSNSHTQGCQWGARWEYLLNWPVSIKVT